MKAWYVREKGADAGEIHFAETAGKAKMAACRKGEWVNEDGGVYWPDIECRRAPEFDGEPHEVTCREWKRAGYSWSNCWECDEPCEEREREEVTDEAE